MKKTLSLLFPVVSLLLIGCSEDSNSTSVPENSSSSGMSEEQLAERCLEKFGITEANSWSKVLSDSSLVKDLICDRTSLFLDEMSGIYVRCVSAKYDTASSRFNMEILADNANKHVWSEVSGCKSKLGSDGDFATLIVRAGEMTFDECLCKTKDGVTYYRNVAPKVAEENSSSSLLASSSSVEPEKDFSSSSFQMIDADFVKIGNQEWMTKNLDVYVDGSMCYGDDPANCTKFGRIYTWSMAMAIDIKYDNEQLGEIALPHRGVCPEGSHLPSYEEWNELNEFIIENPEYLTYFQNQYGGAYDYKGFYRDADTEVNFMSSTEYDVSGTSYPYAYAWLWYIHDDYTYFYKDNGHKYTGAYVRCVKN